MPQAPPPVHLPGAGPGGHQPPRHRHQAEDRGAGVEGGVEEKDEEVPAQVAQILPGEINSVTIFCLGFQAAV